MINPLNFPKKAEQPVALSSRRCNNSKGFTLLELLTVVFIIDVLAAIAFIGYFGYVEKAKIVTVKNELNMLEKENMPEQKPDKA